MPRHPTKVDTPSRTTDSGTGRAAEGSTVTRQRVVAAAAEWANARPSSLVARCRTSAHANVTSIAILASSAGMNIVFTLAAALGLAIPP
jgi:hypothetical protein